MAANKYCNLYGQNKIKDDYDKINVGFAAVEVDVSGVLASEVTRETSETEREVNEYNRQLRYENTKHYGEYDSAFLYHKNNIASSNGSSFMLIVDESVGNAPPVYPLTSNLYWDLVGLKGNKGDTGEVPNIIIGNTTTLQPGNDATVIRRVGSPDTAPIFDFGIPKGIDGTGAGDMTKNTYDTTNTGVVDDSEKLGGQLPTYYAKSADLNAHLSESAIKFGFLDQLQLKFAFGAHSITEIGYETFDSTIAIQNYIDYIHNKGGGTVLISSGKYKTTNVLNVPPDVIVEGQGEYATIIKAYTANQTVFSILSTVSMFTHNSINNLCIEANDVGVIGINTVLSSGLDFLNLLFLGCDTNIHCDRGTNITVDNISVSGLASPSLSAGKSIFESTSLTEYIFDVQINNYQIRNIGNGVNGTSITFNRAIASFIDGYHVNDLASGSTNANGINIIGDCQGCKVYDSIIVKPSNFGIQIEEFDGFSPIAITIDNVDIDQSLGTGIISKGFWVNICGGVISTTVGDSIILGTTNNTVSGVYIVDGGVDGIKVLAGVNNFKIENNHIESCETAIEIVAGTSDGFTITGNNLNVGNTNKIIDNSSGTTKIIKNNIGAIDNQEYASNLVVDMTGGATTETINITIPSGAFATKPLFGSAYCVSPVGDLIVGFYDYDNVATTTTNAVFKVSRLDNGLMGAGVRRFCVLLKS